LHKELQIIHRLASGEGGNAPAKKVGRIWLEDSPQLKTEEELGERAKGGGLLKSGIKTTAKKEIVSEYRPRLTGGRNSVRKEYRYKGGLQIPALSH